MEGRSSEMGSTNPDKNLEEKIKESGAKLESPPTAAEELLPLLDVRNPPPLFFCLSSEILFQFWYILMLDNMCLVTHTRKKIERTEKFKYFLTEDTFFRVLGYSDNCY
jgi:hypothetical protein